MKYQFEALKDYIDPAMMLHEENGDIYFLNNDIEKGSMFFEERDDFVVLWCDKLKNIQREKIYKAMPSILKTTVIFPFVESAEERNLLLSIGAEKVDFQDNLQDDYCQEFGSFALKYAPMQFKKLKIEDIDSVKDKLYLYAPNRSNDYTIAGLFLWRDILNGHVAFEQEGIYIYQYVDGVYLFYFPLCEDIEAGFRKIINYCNVNRLPYGFYPFTEENTEYLRRFNIPFEVKRSDDYNDYLYYIEELADFKGKAFHRHKNHINKFDKEYSNFSFELITETNLDEVKNFFENFAKEKLEEPMDDIEREELLKIPEVLSHMKEYNLFGYCLKIDGVVQGFELGEIVGDMYYSHIQKANRNIDGIYTKIVNLVAKELKGKAVFINREEDMGDLGLRAAKQRYHPCGFVKKEMIFCKG